MDPEPNHEPCKLQETAWGSQVPSHCGGRAGGQGYPLPGGVGNPLQPAGPCAAGRAQSSPPQGMAIDPDGINPAPPGVELPPVAPVRALA